MGASRKKHRPHIIVGKVDQTFDKHTGLRVCVERKQMTKGSRGMTHAGGPVSTVSIRVLDIDAIT